MRRLALYAFWLGLTGCYTPQAVSEGHAVEVWKAAQAEDLEYRSTQSRVLDGSPVISYTAQESAARALRVHPELRVAKARVHSARTHAGALGQIPALELRLTELHLDDLVDGERKFDLGLRFRPELPGLVATERSRAAEEVTVEAARETRLALAVRARAMTLHGEILAGVRRLEILQERSALLEEARGRQESAAAQGASTSLEMNLAQLAAVDAQDDLREAKASLGDLRVELHSLLSLAPGEQLALTGPPGGVSELLEAPPSNDAALEEALKNRPETRERAARLAQAHADVWSEQLKRIPWLSFAQASREIRPKSDVLSWGFALGVDIPIERWFADGAAARRADLEVRRQEERAAILAIAGQVADVLQRVKTSITRYEEVKRLIIPAIDAAQAVTDAKSAERGLDAKRGLRLGLNRLNTQLRALEAERDLIAAQLQLRRVLARP